MNKKIRVASAVLLLLLLAGNVCAQGYGDKWIVGFPNVLITFDPDTIQLNDLSHDPGGCSRELFYETNCVCDRSGNIQFFYNGTAIDSYKGDTLMENGDSLDCCLNQEVYICGSAALSASVIIPSVLDTNKYLVFQTNIDTAIWQDTTIWLDSMLQKDTIELYVCSKVLEHEVDMSYNNGKGKVIEKNKVISRKQYLVMHLGVVKHGNGRDWWLVGHGYNGIFGSNIYYVWLVMNDSVYPPIIQHIGSYDYWDFYGKIAFSPDGSRMAMVTNDDTLDVFNFDRCTGILSNASKSNIHDSVSPPSSSGARSCSFSASSRFLYTIGNEGRIRQFDMNIANLDSSMIVVGEYQFGETCYGVNRENDMGDIQLASDSKIYISPRQGAPCMHIINYPEIKGIGCGFVQNAFPLYNTQIAGANLLSLPNQPNYKLGALIGSGCDTIKGIENVKKPDEGIVIYPNPATDKITIEIINGATLNEISITDVTGRIWKQYTPQKTSSRLSISELPQGIYFVRVKMVNGVVVRKVVKE